jgi:hypothetical protein
MDGLARRSTPVFLFRVFFAAAAPNRGCAPPGAETFRSASANGTMVFDNRRKLACVVRMSRFARRITASFAQSSAMWKGELATRAMRAHSRPRGCAALLFLRATACKGLARLFVTMFSGSSARKKRWVSFMVKLLRAYGGCLGANRRGRTWQAAISLGEPQAGFDPGISEWGNPTW